MATEDIAGKLRAAAARGKKVEFGAGDVIDAGLIRSILLSLPPEDTEGQGPAGLWIEGAADADGKVLGPTIEGRIELNDVAMPGDGAIAPITLTHCILRGGFAGARSRFSSLRLKDCRFEDGPTGDQPTIDLGAARIETGLYMVGLAPQEHEDHLWMRAAGLRIAGALDLSRSRFLAPPDDKRDRLSCDQPVTGIDLSKAVIGADLYGLNGMRCQGGFQARGIHVKGNIWLGGATLEGRGRIALMLQRAIVEGSVLLDARPDRADGSGAVNSFVCVGELRLLGARIGGDVFIADGALIAGFANFRDIDVHSDVTLDAVVRDRIDLQECRVGGSVDLTKLLVGSAFEELTMQSGMIAQSLKRKPPALDPTLVDARHGVLKSIPNAYLVETLWKEQDETGLYQVAFLRVEGDYYLLDGFASGLRQALKRVGYTLETDEQAKEFLHLHGAYARGEAGFPIVVSREDALRFVTDPASSAGRAIASLPDDFFKIEVHRSGTSRIVTACAADGSRLGRYEFTLSPTSDDITVVRNHLEDGPSVDRMPAISGPFLGFAPFQEFGAARRAELAEAIVNVDWPLPSTLPRMGRTAAADRRSLEKALLPRILAAQDLHGEIDLCNLQCEMLEDSGGDGWGPRVCFKLNHFVYRHAEWRPEKARTAGHLIAANWLRSMRTGRLALKPPIRREQHWKQWQVRRNWLFQQFRRQPEAGAAAGDASRRYLDTRIFNFRKIEPEHYHPQPFEQVIRVARSEGRDDAAANFEILKRSIEWRMFNRDVRWLLAFPAIILAASWLILKGGTLLSGVMTGIALVATILAMVFGWAIRQLLIRFLNWRRPAKKPGNLRLAKWAVWLLYAAPPLALLIGLGWFWTPFHFIFAFVIFLAVRLVTTAANGIYRLCFGYARRPIQAIVTLIVAFVIGWIGVHVANRYEMLVVAAEPVSPVAAPAGSPAPGDPLREPRLVMGSRRVAPGEEEFAHEITCRPVISEPLYALDVLIPIIDLGEERHCEVRRLFDRRLDRPVRPGEMSPGDLILRVSEYTLENRRWWWWMKALYAILGWFIVSLAILTFALANRSHGDPPDRA